MSLDRFRPNKVNPDYTYLSLAALLTLFGIVMISSSSVVLSMQAYNQSYGFVTRQVIALVIGSIGTIVASRLDYRIWKRYATPLLILCLALLVVVFIPGIGKSANGAARWINLGSFQLQPSELLKISYVLFLALWLEKRGARLKTLTGGLFPFLLLVAPMVLLLMAQRDLGTLLVVLVTVGIMYVVAGAPYAHIGLGVATGIVLLMLLVVAAPYRMQRLTTFLNPSSDKLGAGYHINQSLIAVGSGGAWGRGFGQSLQKYLYLPEPHTDSIFAIIVEELGFFRALLVLLVIGMFAYRGYQIAAKAGDDFARMTAFGITTWLLFQSLINIGAILGLIPLTGVPLPLISYGGTSLIVSLFGIGIVMNISKHGYGT